eukprot:UN06861
MKNVLRDQSYIMHVKSNLYDTLKERYSQKREAIVKVHAFVALLTIFGAIWEKPSRISPNESKQSECSIVFFRRCVSNENPLARM